MHKCSMILSMAVVFLAPLAVVAASTLDVGLLINGATTVTSYIGWPLLFEVSFANQGAMNDAMVNAQAEAELAELETLVTSGQITATEAEQVRAMLTLREIEPVVLGAPESPWTALVSLRDSGDVLPWPIELLASDVPPVLQLGAEGVAVAWYGLAAAAASLAVGSYEVAVTVSTEGAGPLPVEAWTGTISSSPVQLEIRAEPDLSDALLAQKWIAFGQYALYSGDFAAAETHLLDAIALDSTAEEAWILLGETQYAAGELQAALDSFSVALDLLTARAGSELAPHVEPPSYVILRIAQIQDELGLEPATSGNP